MTPEQIQRFDAKWTPEPNTGCWLWHGASSSRQGYGAVTINKRSQPAHRVSYERAKGPIPSGLFLDHLCRVTCCVNPDHLEPVTCKVNLNRGIHRNAVKTSCIRGHAFDEANTLVLPGGKRRCRACGKEAQRANRGGKSFRLPRLTSARVTSPNWNTTKTHCKRGHEFTPENTVAHKNGRQCRACSYANHNEYMRRRRAKSAQVQSFQT